jgi:hypothetical protein
MYERMNFPTLCAQHFKDARLFATRDDLVKSLTLQSSPSICEIGVALGGFSRVLIDTFKPRTFVANDTFRLHLEKVVWGVPTSETFLGRTHLEYYKELFPEAITLEGMSAECLSALPAKSFDLIYVDAAHDYDNIKQDAEQAVRMIKDDGVIVFNDYIMFDHVQHKEYGVVQVVNELVTASDWKVIGLGLQQHMFCDLAIRRG